MDLEDVKKNVQKGAEIAAEKISQYSRIGKRKMDQLVLKRRIEKNYTSAGLRVYEYAKDNKGDSIPSSLIDEFIQEIDGAQTEIDNLDVEIEKIRAEGKTAKSKDGSDD
ncbi:MAG: hypothetical protein FWF51_07155 [Chitinivibrionia bacterium]|jgi:vacuolar-type H+-ATPase subunit I/STV1|nr:hypothetical protein [Chitinivibrionia bacterium]